MHFQLSDRTSPDSREADVDSVSVSVSGSFVHQSQTAELGHLPPVQELLKGMNQTEMIKYSLQINPLL